MALYIPHSILHLARLSYVRPENFGPNYVYPSTQILGITSTLYAYEDGTDRKFRNVGTKRSDAGRLPNKHNTAFNTRRKFEINIQLISYQLLKELTVKRLNFVNFVILRGL